MQRMWFMAATAKVYSMKNVRFLPCSNVAE